MPRINPEQLDSINFDWQQILQLILQGYNRAAMVDAIYGITSLQGINYRLSRMGHAFDARGVVELMALAASDGHVEDEEAKRLAYRQHPWGALSPLQLTLIELLANNFAVTQLAKMFQHSRQGIGHHLNGICDKFGLPHSKAMLVGRWIIAKRVPSLYRPSPLLCFVARKVALGLEDPNRINSSLSMSDSGVEYILAECAYKLETSVEVMLQRAREGKLTAT